MLGFITRQKPAAQYPTAAPMISRHNPAHLGGFKAATLSLSAELVIEMPNGNGRRVQIDQPAMIIGRSKSVDITLDAPVVSRQHARLERVGDAYWLTDLGSSNGTLVNGAQISSVQLQTGDLITLGYNSAYPISIVFHMDGTNSWLN